MKKFKFTLETLLNVTLALEKEQKNELAIVNKELNELLDRREEMEREILETKSIYSNSAMLTDFINSSNYIEFLNGKIIDINVEILIKENEKQEKQDKLIETMARRKSYEKLKQKQLELYKAELDRENDKNMDDFVSYNSGE